MRHRRTQSCIHPPDVEGFPKYVGMFIHGPNKESLRFGPRSLDWVELEGGSNVHSFEWERITGQAFWSTVQRLGAVSSKLDETVTFFKKKPLSSKTTFIKIHFRLQTTKHLENHFHQKTTFTKI